MKTRVLVVWLFVVSTGLAGEVTIKRDRWGVPHIFAATLADGAYGLGYAQAEDRLEQIFANYRQAAGRVAEVTGPSAVENDFQARLAGHEAVCRRRYPELPAEVRAMCEAFQDGMRAYLAEHPDKKPANALEIEPWMVPALSRSLIFNWPMGAAERELGLRNEWHFFSNEWAVRPERTADGAALLLIDPHVAIEGPFRFYEFRLHAGGHDISGFGPVGAPFLGLGHNAFLGWACTTGGPDTTDIYVEQTDPANPKRYRYDGGWREMTSETVAIAVKNSAPVVRALERSHHGPIALREGKKAYAIACPYFDQIDFITQTHRAMTARNLAEFDAALAMCQMMEQNVMYADVDGNIRYIRTGRVPIRPPGFDFSKPVPGDTSKSEWRGIHPMKDLVQVLNPPTGYLQNCNISPDVMARGLNLDLAAYPQYIVNAGRGGNNSRGRRAVELLEAHPKLTIAEATAIALDVHADRCERWQAALRDAAKKINPDKPALRKAIETILAWNGMMERDSVGATLYRAWRTMAADHKLKTDSPAKALVSALAEAVAWLENNHGTSEVAYGQVNRIRRGDRSWPFSGGDSGGGDMTLRAMASSLDGKVFYGRSGQNWTQLVQFKRGTVRSWSATPFGESDAPSSPHYADQAEQLFSHDQLKPTWFQPSELEGNVESTKVLRRKS
jgi:acyl-homoserine lactone acylase PvdQ